ncbi:hypothetical protein RYH73_15350 [Olivibacter sp. CPCC 100613]
MTTNSIPKINGIITRNTKDFRKSTLPILTPTESLSAILLASKI